MATPHEFSYPRVSEIAYRHPQEFGMPEHDPFIDNDELNYADIEQFDMGIADYAKMLSKAALRDVSLPANITDIEAYRNERNKPAAA